MDKLTIIEKHERRVKAEKEKGNRTAAVAEVQGNDVTLSYPGHGTFHITWKEYNRLIDRVYGL